MENVRADDTPRSHADERMSAIVRVKRVDKRVYMFIYIHIFTIWCFEQFLCLVGL